MADDYNSRYRSGDPLGRTPGTGTPASDPLAELARLIGQSDPYSEQRRDPQPPAQHDAHYNGEPTYYANPAPQYGSEPPPIAYQPEPPPIAYPQQDPPPAPYTGNPPFDYNPAPHYSEPAPVYRNDPAPPFSAEPARTEWPFNPAPPPPGFDDPFALPPAPPMAPAEQGYDPQPYAAPVAPLSPGYAPGYNPAAFQAQDGPVFPPKTYPHEPEAGPMPPPHGDEFYDDAPSSGRRKGLITVMAVFALAVVGTAGAFGYRSMFGSSSSAPPPVIRASGVPSKVAPPPAAAADPANKITYDRFGARSNNEQVVLREEKPVDPAELARAAAAARAAAPPPSSMLASPPAAEVPLAPTASAGNPPSALGEPRRVRTVPIRPDQADPPTRSQVVTPQRQTANAGPNAAPNNPPASLAPPVARTAPPPNARAAVPRTNGRTDPPPANAPLSLSPDNSLPPPPAAMRDDPPPRVAPPPSRMAATTAGQGFLVQVTSQRSESDAQSSFRSLQAKYSSVLGSQGHVVRRADLGAKGVYYRAMVGPFGSREQAVQLCSSLKAAGGDCVIQSN